MLKRFVELCDQSTVIKQYVLFDEQKMLSGKGNAQALHTAFLAVQTLAENIGGELGAERLVSATFLEPNEQYYLRNLELEDLHEDNGDSEVFGVYVGSAGIDLRQTIAMLIETAGHDDRQILTDDDEVEGEPRGSGDEPPVIAPVGPHEQPKLEIHCEEGMTNVIKWSPPGYHRVEWRREHVTPRSRVWKRWENLQLLDADSSGGNHRGVDHAVSPEERVQYRIVYTTTDGQVVEGTPLDCAFKP